MKEKIKTLSKLKLIVEKMRKEGKKIVFTNGCFDLLHRGHIRYLRRAKALGDALIVGLNSDQSVRAIKGKTRPLLPQAERAEILSALEFVDYIIIFKEPSPASLILRLKPDLQVKGGNYRKEEVREKEAVESYGGKVVVVKEEKGYSTTNLIEKIKGRKSKCPHFYQA